MHSLKRASGYAPLPWGVDMLLTDACNLRCTYCPITTKKRLGSASPLIEIYSTVYEGAAALQTLRVTP